MLLFIIGELASKTNRSKFQYITCYSLSPPKGYYIDENSMFQYITCYSLSFLPSFLKIKINVSIHHMLLFIRVTHQSHVALFYWFQYITCYSLSWNLRKKGGRKTVSIHHMLLFIIKQHITREVKLCFNTSHVTLYQFTAIF